MPIQVKHEGHLCMNEMCKRKPHSNDKYDTAQVNSTDVADWSLQALCLTMFIPNNI